MKFGQVGGGGQGGGGYFRYSREGLSIFEGAYYWNFTVIHSPSWLNAPTLSAIAGQHFLDQKCRNV